MSWQERIFSAEQAWRHPFFRWMSLAVIFLYGLGTGYFFYRLLPVRHERPTFIMHYNVYLGIDRVQSWNWVWVLPVLWLLFLVLDLLFAFGWYHADPPLAKAFLLFACAWSLPWAMALFYLARINI